MHDGPDTLPAPPAAAQTGAKHFNTLIGLVLTEQSEGVIRGHLDLGPEHLNASGIAHGGVLASMLDSVCSGAGLYCPEPGRVRRCATLSLTVNFTGMARNGRLHASGLVISSGRKIFSAEGELRDAEGKLCAHAIGTFKYFAPAPT